MEESQSENGPDICVGIRHPPTCGAFSPGTDEHNGHGENAPATFSPLTIEALSRSTLLLQETFAEEHLTGHADSQTERGETSQLIGSSIRSTAQVANCPICQNVPVAPRLLSPCGHVLCDTCWTQLFQHDSYDSQCPVCRSSITETTASVTDEVLSRRALGNQEYNKRLAESRETILQAALEPATVRPPLALLQQDYALAQESFRAQEADYAAAQKAIKWRRLALQIGGVVVTLCPLFVVALVNGWERWVICALLTIGTGRVLYVTSCVLTIFSWQAGGFTSWNMCSREKLQLWNKCLTRIGRASFGLLKNLRVMISSEYVPTRVDLHACTELQHLARNKLFLS